MINMPLLKKEIKSSYKIILIFIALITMYSTVIVAMFDENLTASLDMMAQSMPELFAAFGMNNMASSLIEFIANYLYGMILILVPMICIVIMANKLIAKYVDSGSMAFLLSGPHSRKTIVMTQITWFIIVIAFIAIYATCILIVASEIFFSGALDIPKLIMLNVGLFAILLLMGSLCFLASTIFNETRLSYGVSSGLVIVSILVQMLSQVSDKLDFLKYFTPLTLFDVNGILEGTAVSNSLIINMILASIIIFILSSRIFIKKDLSV